MASIVRNVVVGLFGMVGALGLIACSGTGTADVGGDDDATSQDQALLKEGACLSEYMGGATSCKDAGTWKEYAAKACASRGLDLTTLDFGATCKGGFTEAKYSCCKSAPKPIPPKPGPEPIACFGDVQGGPTSCKPVEIWKQYADTACKTKGAQVVAIDYAEECDKGSFRWTKYECCDATKPPPPPPPVDDCKIDLLGDGKTCKDIGSWKAAAIADCAEQKLEFADVSFGGGCANGLSSEVKVKCCGVKLPPPPPPPPPPSSCEWRYLGNPDGLKCSDPGTWKQLAYDSCTKSGLKVGELSFPDLKCNATGATSEVKFTCCK